LNNVMDSTGRNLPDTVVHVSISGTGGERCDTDHVTDHVSDPFKLSDDLTEISEDPVK